MRRKYKEEASVRVGDRKLVTIQEDMDLALTRFIEHNRKLVFTFYYHTPTTVVSDADNSTVQQLKFCSTVLALNTTASTSR